MGVGRRGEWGKGAALWKREGAKAKVNPRRGEVKCTFSLYLVKVNASAVVSEYDLYVVQSAALLRACPFVPPFMRRT